MASPMVSSHSLASPSLTHGGSEFSYDENEFIDFGAFEASTLATPSVSIAQNDSLSALAKTTDFQDLYRQFFPQDKAAPAMLSPAFGSPSITTDSLFNSEFSLSAASIDPSLVESAGLSLNFDEVFPEVETMQEVEAEAIAPTEEDPSYTPNAATEVVRQKKTRAASKRIATASKRKTKSVADLALPLPLSATARPIALAKPPVKEEDTETSAKAGGHHLPHIVFPVPDYIDRPSTEEYNKLSSKEKRQMRNKISARNFRHRRKEYIGTLEEEIASRDDTISTLQEEMGILRTENTSLRSDLNLLKSTVEKLLAENRPRSPKMPTASTSLLPNLSKDVAPFSTRSNFASFLPSLSVHTTLLPLQTPAFASPARNMNPAMQGVTANHTQHLPGRSNDGPSNDDSFWGSNPTTLTGISMDRYRSSLYGKLAHNLNGIRAAKENPITNFKPTFFAPFATKPALARVNTNDDDVSDEESDCDVDGQVQEAVASQTAYVAQVAQSTLVQGVFSHFWNAFIGNPSTADGGQVADLLSGRSELCVVPAQSRPVEDLSDALSGLTVRPRPQTRNGRKI